LVATDACMRAALPLRAGGNMVSRTHMAPGEHGWS
jgi:hypothetical protein